MRRFHVTTFGCQMNVHDSERIKGMLEAAGMGEASSEEQADVLVFNTCTIRERADDRLVQRLHNAKNRKDDNPDLQIIGSVDQWTRDVGNLLSSNLEALVQQSLQKLRLPSLTNESLPYVRPDDFPICI